MKKEIEHFAEESTTRINSISSRLVRKTFRFPEAKGIPVPKRDEHGNKLPGKFRPIVLAPVESRIVQRAILDVLTPMDGMRAYTETPFSFGGVRKGSQRLAAVPAAIAAALGSISEGARYVMSADIRSFFTRISKAEVTATVSSIVNCTDFMDLFGQAIHVELSNMAELRDKAEAFPIEDIGVAQGNSLSPLLGNIVLRDFDTAMNEGDCRCIRYIDDFLILALT